MLPLHQGVEPILFMCMFSFVPTVGLEPTRYCYFAPDPKSGMSANSTTRALLKQDYWWVAVLNGNRKSIHQVFTLLVLSWLFQVSPDIGTPQELPLKRFLSSSQTHDLNYVRYLYPRRDSNPHATITSPWLLRPLCLPIPSPGHHFQLPIIPINDISISIVPIIYIRFLTILQRTLNNFLCFAYSIS